MNRVAVHAAVRLCAQTHMFDGVRAVIFIQMQTSHLPEQRCFKDEYGGILPRFSRRYGILARQTYLKEITSPGIRQIVTTFHFVYS